MNIDGKTKLYGIIGNPVSHSLSPAMHNAAFAALGENRVYLPFPVENIGDALIGLKALDVGGVSVTIPHKESVMAELDEIDSIAEKIGAVNTIVITGNGNEKKISGTNTDWAGANRALEQKISLKGRRALILGAGGSARAIGFGLLEAGSNIEICSRTEPRGRKLAAVLGCPWKSLADPEPSSGDILINATSVGMSPNDQLSPFDKKYLEPFQVVMDIVYAPLQTRLLRDAEQVGCTCVNGLEMLLYQGVEQFELWTGLRAPVEVMRMALLRGTSGRQA